MTQSLWELAMMEHKLKEEKNDNSEAVFVFCGSRSCGKSTLINIFLEKDETPKPTLALEYGYGRRSMGPYMSKSVVHIWELGGGCRLSNLLDVTVSRTTIENLHLIVVVDLSLPNSLWSSLIELLNAYKARVKKVMDRMSLGGNDMICQNISNKSQCRVPESHCDRELLDTFPIPLIIIGSKYDEYIKLKQEDQQFISRALRFVAHFYSGALFFVNMTDIISTKRIQAYLNNIAFGIANMKSQVISQDKPLYILPGQDTFASIGPPPMDMEIRNLSEKTPLGLWEISFCTKYPQVTQKSLFDRNDDKTDPDFSELYVEPQIDNAKLTKDEELERYRRQSERIMREQMKQAADEGVFIA